MSKYPSDESKKFMTRMPDSLHEALVLSARRNSRSMNAELVARLAQTFGPDFPVETLTATPVASAPSHHHELALYVARGVCDAWSPHDKAEEAAKAYLAVLSRLGKKGASDGS